MGSEPIPSGGVRFRIWAPARSSIGLWLQGPRPADEAALLTMQALDSGWHELTVGHAAAGWRYHYVLPDGQRVPDPESRFQPEDVHGPSEVIDPDAYCWRDAAWPGLSWHHAVIYELHVGTFTAAGSFTAAIDRLGYLADLGITAIQLMPIADFPARATGAMTARCCTRRIPATAALRILRR